MPVGFAAVSLPLTLLVGSCGRVLLRGRRDLRRRVRTNRARNRPALAAPHSYEDCRHPRTRAATRPVATVRRRQGLYGITSRTRRLRPGQPSEMCSDVPSHVTSVMTMTTAAIASVRRRGTARSYDARADSSCCAAPSTGGIQLSRRFTQISDSGFSSKGASSRLPSRISTTVSAGSAVSRSRDPQRGQKPRPS
jgi:hypothetical protein